MDAANAVLWIQKALCGVKPNTEDASFVLRFKGASFVEFFDIAYEPSKAKEFHIEGKTSAIGGRIEITESGWWVTRVDYFDYVEKL